jgi:pyrimidine deaminase RibD-like protein
MPFRPLKSFYPTADELLQQDLPALGAVLLRHLKSYEGLNTVYQHAGLNRGYFRAVLENRNVGLGPLPKEPEYGIRQPEVTKRIMEAWSWLERQGLLIRNDGQTADWLIISSDGERWLNSGDLEAVAQEYRAARPSDANEHRQFMLLAIEEAKKSIAEDGRPHPRVGAVVVNGGKILATAHRGENLKSHAEYVALEEKLSSETVAGATVYTTLEPCIKRNAPKICCAQRLVDRRVARVFIGMLDPNPDIRGLGEQLLSEAGIETQLFPRDLRAQVEEMNREFIRDQKQRSKARASSKSGATLADSPDHQAESSELQYAAIVSEIILEARYINRKDERRVFQCQSISEYSTKYVEDGGMRSRLERPLIVKGIDVAELDALAWEPTHILYRDPATGREREFAVYSGHRTSGPASVVFDINY